MDSTISYTNKVVISTFDRRGLPLLELLYSIMNHEKGLNIKYILNQMVNMRLHLTKLVFSQHLGYIFTPLMHLNFTLGIIYFSYCFCFFVISWYHFIFQVSYLVISLFTLITLHFWICLLSSLLLWLHLLYFFILLSNVCDISLSSHIYFSKSCGTSLPLHLHLYFTFQ